MSIKPATLVAKFNPRFPKNAQQPINQRQKNEVKLNKIFTETLPTEAYDLK
jgi:hypothetical protein